MRDDRTELNTVPDESSFIGIVRCSEAIMLGLRLGSGTVGIDISIRVGLPLLRGAEGHLLLSHNFWDFGRSQKLS